MCNPCDIVDMSLTLIPLSLRVSKLIGIARKKLGRATLMLPCCTYKVGLIMHTRQNNIEQGGKGDRIIFTRLLVKADSQKVCEFHLS